MRLLFILTQDITSPSGVGRYFPLAKELVKLGNKVNILALHPDFTQLNEKKQLHSGVCVEYVAPMHVKKSGSIKSYYSPIRLLYQSALATIQLSQAAWKIPTDIVHIGKPHPMNGIAGLMKRLQKNVVYVDCDDDEAGSGVFSSNFQRNIISWFERGIPQKAQYATTNTHYTQNRLVDFGINPNRIIYLSSGVDLERFPTPDMKTLEELRRRLGIEQIPVISYIGSLSLASHPVDLLFLAFCEVLKANPDVKLLVVGGGDGFVKLQELAVQLGIAQSVIFTGHVPADSVVNYYHLSFMVVDPVLDDRAARGRQPLKLFECWACGIPYVSADVGDRAEILGAPPAGILSRPGDAHSLAAAITLLLDKPHLCDELRALGKKRVQDHTWEHLAAQLNDEYIRRFNP